MKSGISILKNKRKKADTALTVQMLSINWKCAVISKWKVAKKISSVPSPRAASTFGAGVGSCMPIILCHPDNLLLSHCSAWLPTLVLLRLDFDITYYLWGVPFIKDLHLNRSSQQRFRRWTSFSYHIYSQFWPHLHTSINPQRIVGSPHTNSFGWHWKVAIHFKESFSEFSPISSLEEDKITFSTPYSSHNTKNCLKCIP